MSLLAFSSSRSVTTWIVSSSESRPCVGLGAHVDELDVPSPLRRLQAVLGHLGAHALGLRALLVDLVDGHDDRDFGGLGVVDRLLGLRLDAIVGGDDDHREIGHARAACAHRGERLVAGGVQEGDLLAAVVDLIGADVLGDAAGLARDDLGLADRVEQRGLAVVDVPHDRDDRRAFDEVLFGILELGLDVDIVGGVHDLDLLVELVCEHLDRIVGEGLRSVAISPRDISFLITSGTATPRYSATSLTVEPELTLIRSVASIAVLSIGAIVSS